MNPLSAVAELIVGLHRTGKLSQWARTWTSLSLVMFGAFLGSCGYSLHSGLPWLISLGDGMMASASALALFVSTSPTMRGMAVASFKPALKESDIQIEGGGK